MPNLLETFDEILPDSAFAEFSPEPDENHIAAAIAVLMTPSGAIKSWQVRLASTKTLTADIPTSTQPIRAPRKTMSAVIDVDLQTITFPLNSVSTEYKEMKEMIKEEHIRMYSDDGELIDPSDILPSLKDECCIRFSITSNMTGSGLDLQILSLQATRNLIKSKPHLAGDAAPGSLVATFPLSIDFIRFSEIHGPKVKIFSSKPGDLVQTFNLKPDVILSGLNLLYKSFIRRELFENPSAEKSFIKTARQHTGDTPFYATPEAGSQRKKRRIETLTESAGDLLNMERVHSSDSFPNQPIPPDPILSSSNTGRMTNMGHLFDPDAVNIISETNQDHPPSNADLCQLQSMLPNLAKFSPMFLAGNNLPSLLKLSAIGNSVDGSTRSLEVKLDNNARIRDQGKMLPASKDNGVDVLHEARFLPAPACPLSTLAKLAKTNLSNSPNLPVSDYDMSSFGMINAITPRGWNEAHLPESRGVQLKLYASKNCSNSTKASDRLSINQEGISVGDLHKDLVNHSEIRKALWAYTVAIAHARPWDRSALLIMTFMINNNFLCTELSPQHVCNFIDELIGINRQAFVCGEPPLTVSKIQSEFWDYKSRNFGGLPHPAYQRSVARRDPARPTYQKITAPTGKPLGPEPCRRYNKGVCPNQKNSCSIRLKSGSIIPLLHVCNHKLPTGALCRKDHAATIHN